MLNAYMIRSKILGAVAREDAERTTYNIVNIHLDQMAGPEVDLGVLREIGFVCATSEDERHGLSDLMKRGNSIREGARQRSVEARMGERPMRSRMLTGKVGREG
jgi:hypothetical protein